MTCAFCGNTNEPGVRFCTRCGAQIQQESQNRPDQHFQQDRYDRLDQQDQQGRYDMLDQQGQQGHQDQQYHKTQGPPDFDGFENTRRHSAGASLKTLPLKKILLIAIPVVVLIIAAIIVVPMIGGSSRGARKDHIELFSNKGELIVSGNNNEKFTINGNSSSSQVSLDGSKAVVMTDYNSSSGGVLWFVTPSGATKIADDVFAFKLSDSGNGVVYFTEYDDKISEAVLYLYDTSGKKATLVTDNAYFNGYATMPGVAISPNGKSVGYIMDYDERNYEFTGYIRIDGKSQEKVGDEMFAEAISDGGKYLYYRKVDVKTGEASLHVRSGRNEFRLVPDASNVQIMLNKDYSEILLSVYNGDRRTFISRKGGERERISGAAILSLVMPRGSPVRTCNTDFSNIIVYGKSSLSDFVAITGEGLAYYNKNLEANKIAASSNYANMSEISSDGKTLYFINNSNRLSSIDPTVPGAERKEIEKDVLAFVASGDGKSVYYISEENELYHVRGNGTQTLIAEDVYSGCLAISYSSNRVFFLLDYRDNRGGEMFFSNNGGKRAKVSGADDVMTLWSTPANIFFISRDDELFRSSGNEKFVLFHDEIDR